MNIARMSIEVRLYGKFGKLCSEKDYESGSIGIIDMDENKFKKISDVTDYLGIKKDEISHIFFNGEYSNPKRRITEGGRLAIFPRDMGLLYKWYFTPKE
ncbi:MAG: hypothetical protein ACOCSA_01935 [Candidatus Hadarchaeota archaeon]